MKHWKRRLALLLAAALCVSALAGCARGGDAMSLSVCVGGAPEELDPIYATEPADQTILVHLYENLMRKTAGASGAIAMTLEMFSSSWIAAGLDPEWVHRVVVTASGGFDTVPWNSFVVLILAMGKLDHKRSYMPIFWVSLVAPILVALLGVFFV